MVRVRNLVLAIAAASALTSEMAYALGLGEVTLKSALNQPLVAEIELLDAKSLAPGEVVPVLASAEDFNRAGVDRQYFLTDLKFTPVLRPDGKSVIQISSSKPVREPYLNFLVEVIWPSGRLLREYTLLLDPPLYSPEIAAAVAPQLPATALTPRRGTTPRASSPTTSATASGASPTTVAAQSGEYKTTANDTLWEIAERNRQGGTVHQTMLAIQDLNQDAFIAGNINRMKSGQVLRLPSAEQIGSRSQAEAIQQVAQQNASWRQGTSATAARQIDATQRSSAGAAPTRSETGDSLRLVAPETGKSTTGSDSGSAEDGAALRDKLALTQESLDSSRRENTDLKDRLGDLQGQLDKLQRLMQLKDDQLAKLQAQLASEGDVAATDSTSITQSNDGSAAVAGNEVTAPALDEPTPDQAGQVDAEAEDSASSTAAPVTADTAPQPAAEQQPTPPVAKRAPAAPTVAETEQDGFLKEITANPVILGVLGGSALLLLLIGLMALSRRNAMKEAELQESLLAESQPSDHLFDMEADDHTAVAQEAAEQNVPADSEAQRLDDPAGSTGDALSEADIYIAYGRFNQAVELLQNALNDEPQRADLRLKLMEVYAELGDRDGFVREEAELREIGGSAAGIDQLKAKYPAMVASAGVAASTVASDDFDSFSLDDLELDEPAPAVGKDTDDAFDLSLDDLELDSVETPSTAPAASGSLAADELSFDEFTNDATADGRSADEFSFELDSEPTSSNVSLEDELAGFSLDLDSEQSAGRADDELLLSLDDETLGNAPLASAEPVENSNFDFELPEVNQPEAGMSDEFDLSLDQQPTEPEPNSFAAQLGEVEAELEDLSRDLEQPLDEVQNPPVEAVQAADDSLDEMNEDFDFLSDTDETTTKLDLARAYIDMGDAEGARDILDEVISEGSDTQQQEARDMLAKLA